MNDTDIDNSLAAPPSTLGDWMLSAAVSVWLQYDEEDNFEVHRDFWSYTLFDPEIMAEPKNITTVDFFNMHKRLIWNANISNYRFDWIDFAFKGNGAAADEYDDNTVDAVLQNMLYGKVVYG